MKLATREKCTGCMACVWSCPIKCIYTEQDSLGHIYPLIDVERCIECKKCESVCPEINPCLAYSINKAYATWSLNPEERQTSASGGAASVFYRKALELGFFICGVEYKEDFHVVHTLSRNKDSIKKYKQSKYVFSEMNEIYKEVKQQLENGKKILFISLPCKVAGLLNYIGKKKENLVTVDIVCHGTPSFQMLKEHISAVDKKNIAKEISFRQDNEFIFALKDVNGNFVCNKVGRTDTYLAGFLEGLNYRSSCYECNYARPERISDITICDFWGLGTEIPFNHPYSGAISAVLINTEQGDVFFKNCKEEMFVEERTVEEAIKGNAQLMRPTEVHSKRYEFETLYKRHGFENAVETCLYVEMKEAAKIIKKNQIRKNIRKVAGLFFERYRG